LPAGGVGVCGEAQQRLLTGRAVLDVFFKGRAVGVAEPVGQQVGD
jgi:hypothetical protein